MNFFFSKIKKAINIQKYKNYKKKMNIMFKCRLFYHKR